MRLVVGLGWLWNWKWERHVGLGNLGSSPLEGLDTTRAGCMEQAFMGVHDNDWILTNWARRTQHWRSGLVILGSDELMRDSLISDWFGITSRVYNSI
jgi:hypothetical protein